MPQSKVSYQGLAHTQSPTVARHHEERISARWEWWKPAAITAARETTDPAAQFRVLQEFHRERLRALLGVSVSWASILRNNLDDPRLDGDKWRAIYLAAIERRRSRLGRVKGKGKKYARKRRTHPQ
jgi:hypothetical protein